MVRAKFGVLSERTTTARRGPGLRTMLLATTAFVALAPVPPVAAQTAWTGANSNNWFDAGNWSAGTPTIATDAEIDTIALNVPAVFAIGANALSLTVGNTGHGALVVQGGGVLLNTTGYLGRGGGSVGTATVLGANSVWANTGNFYVGDQGTGMLTIAAGGKVSSHDSFVGNSGSGFVTVTGAGSTWTLTDPLTVGNSGTGSVTIDNGGAVVAEETTLGAVNGSQGTVTISGPGSSWTGSGGFIVGDGGTGTVTVSGGAKVETQFLVAGFGQTGLGSVTISGAGTSWTTSASAGVGSDGVGHLRVEAGGALSVVGLSFGSDALASGTGTVTGPGSSLTASGGIYVGGGGSGTLTVSDGATVTSADATIALAGTGVVTVTGAGSRWTNDTTFRVGANSGFATLNVAAGGKVETLDSIIGDNGQGVLNVSGAGSSFVNTANMLIGDERDGAVLVTAGGQVAAQSIIVANETNATGAISVSGAGSSLVAGANLFVGRQGNGIMFVEDGGAVSSANAGLGATAGSIGEVTVTGTGSSWLNSGDLFIGGDGTGALTVAKGGRVEVGGTAQIAVNAGSTGTLVIGAAKGQAAVTPGAFTANAISFGAGSGKIVFNHLSNGYQFAAGMSGSGTIEAVSGTTVLTGNSSGFTGATTVSGATLAVNGSLGGTLDILAGGRLQGAGTVSSVSIANGGTLAPGNSLGTLNVAGNMTFGAGSRYEVEVDPASNGSDRVHATGSVTINGGAVRHIGLDGTYRPLQRYTIVTADGGVTGAFASVVSDYAFLDPTLSYDPNNVYLRLVRNDVSFCAIGQTQNQCASGNGVQSLGLGNQVHDAILMLDEGGARRAFDQLSGAIHASAKGVLLEESTMVRAATLDRLRQAFGGVGAAPMPTLSYGYTADLAPAVKGPMPRPGQAERFAVWGQGYGSWGRSDSDRNAARLTRSTGGMIVGADIAVFDTLRFGALAGYSRTSFEVKDRLSSGDSDNYHLGLYGGGQWGAFGLRTGASYSWHEIETARSIAFAGFGDSLKGSYTAGTAQVFGELGYRIDLGRVALEPFAGLAYVNLQADGFTERGGGAALRGQGSDTGLGYSTLGLRASTSVALQGMDLTLRGALAWRHAFGDTTPLATLAFAGGSPFSVAGLPIARNAALVEAGLDLAVGARATLGLSYSGQLASDVQDHAFKGNLAIRF
jgi:outer membrane autotransporter protein